jgi:hypothetical protein
MFIPIPPVHLALWFRFRKTTEQDEQEEQEEAGLSEYRNNADPTPD